VHVVAYVELLQELQNIERVLISTFDYNLMK